MLNTEAIEWLIPNTCVSPWVLGYVSQLGAMKYMRCCIYLAPARRDKYIFSLTRWAADKKRWPCQHLFMLKIAASLFLGRGLNNRAAKILHRSSKKNLIWT